MPPARWLNRPAWAKPYAIAIEPTAVTIHDSSEIAPTCAMFVGSMMMPEPIMLTATMNVSWIRFIFFCSAMVSLLRVPPCDSLADGVGMELDATVHLLLVHALHFVVEAGKAVERLLERQEVVEHRPRPLVPSLARHDDADAGRVDQCERRGDAARDLIERHVVDLVRDELLVGVLRRHRELREAARAEAFLLQLLDV